MARVRRQPRLILAATSLALALPALAACGGDDGRIDDPQLPYSFTYPEQFESDAESTAPAQGQSYENQTIVAKENGQDLVAVQTQPLRRPVTPDLVDNLNRELAQMARRVGTVRDRQDVRLAGLDGVRFEMRLRGDTGVPVEARRIYAAEDRTLFYINCQWRSDRAAVLDACDEVVRSFETR